MDETTSVIDVVVSHTSVLHKISTVRGTQKQPAVYITLQHNVTLLLTISCSTTN